MLDQKKVIWGIDAISYWENDSGDFCFEKPYTGNVDEDILSGFLKKKMYHWKNI